MRNMITAFFAMIIAVALSACAGSGNINYPQTRIYTTGQGGRYGQGQAVSTTSSPTTDFDGNPCMKSPGASQTKLMEEIAKNYKLVSSDPFAGKTYIMEEGARSGNPHNELWVMPAGKTVYVDSKGIPAYWPECGNRIGEIQTPAVVPAPIVPQGNSGVYVDSHQENHTSWSLVLAPNLSISTSGGYYGGYNYGYSYGYGYHRPVCRTAQIRPDCYRQQVYSCPVPTQQYCPPPNPAGARNGHGGLVYNTYGRAVGR